VDPLLGVQGSDPCALRGSPTHRIPFFGSLGGSASREVDPHGPPPVGYPLKTRPIEIAESVPVRLVWPERKLQRLIRGVLLTSNYTDKVDTDKANRTPAHRNMAIMREVLRVLGGLAICDNIRDGARTVVEGEYAAREKEIKEAVQVARRFKIMNPDHLRTDYVKFLYLVQDAAQNPACRESLGFNPVTPIVTVGGRIAELGLQGMLEDERLRVCITPVPRIKSNTELNKALRYKDRLVSLFCKEWAVKSTTKCTPDDVELIVRSLNDQNDFADANVDSTKKLADLLREHFSPDTPRSTASSLAIREEEGGSRLTHEHAKQYHFVLQSLTLWKNICSRMYELWMIAEQDLLDDKTPYELKNTGQGLQRVQPAPTLYKALSQVLADTKRELGEWVGSERIHLGDNQVPNAFHFIDKYAGISRIVVPILRVVEMLENPKLPSNVVAYCDENFSGVLGAQKAVLRDFFRHGFDGSGGDNMDDAGSCIDGRLTSAWNWCNQIRTKPFYPLFLMAGFNSFDGDLSM